MLTTGNNTEYVIATENVVYINYGLRLDNTPVFIKAHRLKPKKMFIENRERVKIDIKTISVNDISEYTTYIRFYLPKNGYVVMLFNNQDLDVMKEIIEKGAYVLSIYDLLENDDGR